MTGCYILLPSSSDRVLYSPAHGLFQAVTMCSRHRAVCLLLLIEQLSYAAGYSLNFGLQDSNPLFFLLVPAPRPNCEPKFDVFRDSDPILLGSPSPLRREAWRRLLLSYPGNLPLLLDGILTFGARLGYEGPEQFILSRNLPIELPDHDVLDKKAAADLAAGLIAPITPKHPCMVSPLGVVPKGDGGRRRIHPLSGRIRKRSYPSRVCINHLRDLRHYRGRRSTSRPGLHDYQTRYSRCFSDGPSCDQRSMAPRFWLERCFLYRTCITIWALHSPFPIQLIRRRSSLDPSLSWLETPSSLPRRFHFYLLICRGGCWTRRVGHQ